MPKGATGILFALFVAALFSSTCLAATEGREMETGALHDKDGIGRNTVLRGGGSMGYGKGKGMSWKGKGNGYGMGMGWKSKGKGYGKKMGMMGKGMGKKPTILPSGVSETIIAPSLIFWYCLSLCSLLLLIPCQTESVQLPLVAAHLW